MKFIYKIFSLLLVIFFSSGVLAETLDGGDQIARWIIIFVCMVFWSLAIIFCQKGGGWILLGVLVALFIALPLTAFALYGLSQLI